MRTWYSGAALAVALIGAVAFTNGPSTAPIEGRVTDLEGLVIQSAHVRVTDETTGASAVTLTEMNGHFAIRNLEPTHTYAIDVLAIGYVPFHTAGVHPTSAGAALGDVTMEPIAPVTSTRVAVR
jgi:Carboxypeptidase regulatory-like domain